MRSIVAAALLLGGCAEASAAQEILAAGGLYGGPEQVRVVCYIFNAGSTPVGLAGTHILDQNGILQPLVVEQCGPVLAPGGTCGVAADTSNNQPYGCRSFVDQSKEYLRGVLEVRDVQQRPLAQVELR